MNVSNHLNKGIKDIIYDSIKISLKSPSTAMFFIRTMIFQKKAAQRRIKCSDAGINIPPFIIASITRQCNLKCKGCYARELHGKHGDEMTVAHVEKLFEEAKELGVSFILIAGGEPLVRKDILDLAGNFQKILFPIFTNGMLIDDKMIKKFSKQKNLIPILSLEGFKNDTDDRRGTGVYERVKKIFIQMQKSHVFFGTSVTVTSDNYDMVTGDDFVEELIKTGCKLFLFVEYVPVKEISEGLCLNDEQRRGIIDKMEKLRNKYPALFIAFPGDEEALGGCLAAGRGFVHISPDGGVEPCPFAPYSDVSIKDTTLKQALKSKLLNSIRENHSMLVEGKGGCTLWENREWVQKLLCGQEQSDQCTLEK